MRATDLPAVRHAMAKAMKAWPEDGKGDVPGARREGLTWQIAELYWVAQDMARVALDASLDMPDFTFSQIIPCDVGLIFFDGGLPSLPIIAADQERTGVGTMRHPELPVDYFLWYRQGSTLNLQYGCTMARAVASGFDPYHQHLPLIAAGTVYFEGFMDTTIYAGESYTGGEQVAIAKVSTINMLAATWSLMGQETVASTQRQVFQPSSGQYKKGRRPGTVTTVALRRMRVVSEEIDRETGRKYTHRFVVRGHWRQQAHGPNRSERRTIWVPSYIKGPEGAPLLHSEKVMVWRR